MTPDQIVERLLDVGFRFDHTPDGGVSFVRPAADTVESDDLLAIVAWRWGELESVVLEHLAVTKTPEIHQSPGRERRAAG